MKSLPLFLPPPPPLTPRRMHGTARQLMLSPFSILRLRILFLDRQLFKPPPFCKCSLSDPSPPCLSDLTSRRMKYACSLPHWVLPLWVSSPVTPVPTLITIISLPTHCAFDSPHVLLLQTRNYLKWLLRQKKKKAPNCINVWKTPESMNSNRLQFEKRETGPKKTLDQVINFKAFLFLKQTPARWNYWELCFIPAVSRCSAPSFHSHLLIYWLLYHRSQRTEPRSAPGGKAAARRCSPFRSPTPRGPSRLQPPSSSQLHTQPEQGTAIVKSKVLHTQTSIQSRMSQSLPKPLTPASKEIAFLRQSRFPAKPQHGVCHSAAAAGTASCSLWDSSPGHNVRPAPQFWVTKPKSPWVPTAAVRRWLPAGWRTRREGWALGCGAGPWAASPVFAPQPARALYLCAASGGSMMKQWWGGRQGRRGRRRNTKGGWAGPARCLSCYWCGFSLQTNPASPSHLQVCHQSPHPSEQTSGRVSEECFAGCRGHRCLEGKQNDLKALTR